MRKISLLMIFIIISTMFLGCASLFNPNGHYDFVQYYRAPCGQPYTDNSLQEYAADGDVASYADGKEQVGDLAGFNYHGAIAVGFIEKIVSGTYEISYSSAGTANHTWHRDYSAPLKAGAPGTFKITRCNEWFQISDITGYGKARDIDTHIDQVYKALRGTEELMGMRSQAEENRRETGSILSPKSQEGSWNRFEMPQEYKIGN